MPRIPPTLLRHARRIDRLLPPLLPVCRDLPSSQNELRWLGEHAAEVALKHANSNKEYLLQQYVNRRAKGEPLQYILGTEFFGELEIKCRSGVLIPRQETAASVSHLAQLLLQVWKNSPPAESINVLDLCTGTGCIPLLFTHELFNRPDAEPNIGHIVGMDISPKALELAEENRSLLLVQQSHGQSTLAKHRVLCDMQFIKADILASHNDSSSVTTKLQSIRRMSSTSLNYDIMISNPPYISTSAFRRTTAASVRKYEPKLALVPPPSPSTHTKKDQTQTVEDGDLFYPKLFELAAKLDTKVVLFEVADMEQACRVAGMAGEHWDIVEIWRDDPGAGGYELGFADVGFEKRRKVRVRGAGNGRSVVAYRGEGCQWHGSGD